MVEDEPGHLETWDREIRYYNEEDLPVKFEVVFASSQEEAEEALRARYIHCASVDLRMPVGGVSSGPSSAEVGNAILRYITTEVGIPTVVYSAAPEDAEDFIGRTRIRLITKGAGEDPLREAVDWLASHAPLIDAMEKSHMKMRAVSAGLFSDYLWPRWSDAWRSRSDVDFDLNRIVARHLAVHIAEVADLELGKYHPEEVYIKPSIGGGGLSTGDIIKQGESYSVVVTPRCNLSNGSHPKNIILAPCVPIPDVESMIARWDPSAENGKALKLLSKFANQNHQGALGTHFLPPCGEAGPWLIEFRDCSSVGEDKIPSLLEARIASISPAFLPNLVQRYAAYIGRIGQPELNVEALAKVLVGLPRSRSSD